MSTSRKAGEEGELHRIDVYSPEDEACLDLGQVEAYLRSLFPTVKLAILSSIFSSYRGKAAESIAGRLASTRVKDPTKSEQSFEPMYGEVDYEKRAILGKVKLGGIVYDGRRLENMFLTLLGPKQSVECCSIVFTRRLVSTFSRDDLRHHLRTVVCGFPSIISIPGIVEAPAKPREYYVLMQQLEAVRADELQRAQLKSRFKGSFIDYDDPGIVEVLKGLALQSVMFHLTLDPFCDKVSCRLYNAHWQEELIKSQLISGRLCFRHSKLMKKLGQAPMIVW